jgi:ribonucleoside-diphosphate reductase alpha chain
MTELTETAKRILRKRYFLKDDAGNPKEDFPALCKRVVDHVYVNDQLGLDNAYQALLNLEFLPNSPCLVNAGTVSGGLSACFVVGNKDDSTHGLFFTIEEFAHVARKGGGCGTTFNHIRPRGAKVHSSTHTQACGVVEHMRMISEAMNSFTQGGFRGMANMGTLRVDHPEILDFIQCKTRKRALRTLIREDITGLYDSLMSNLSPQLEIVLDRFIANFNISVLIPDWFMTLVLHNKWDANIDLWFDKPSDVYGTATVREIWNAICKSAWESGDPGVMFIDTINRTSPYRFSNQEIEATNPCSEQALPPYGACNLGSIALQRFYDPDSGVDWERLRGVIQTGVRFLDNVVQTCDFPTQNFEVWAALNRPVGLGVMGFADLLLLNKIKYDSLEAVKFAEKLAGFIFATAQQASVDLAKQRGTPECARFEELGYRRNVTIVSIAPTGTISQIAGCQGSGIEPIFAPKTLRFDNTGSSVVDHELANEDYFQCAVDEERNGEREVSVDGHLNMLAVWNRHCDSGVSKTINMRNSATVDDVQDVYRNAFLAGVRSVSLYRNGCKKVQVLNTVEPDVFGGDGQPRDTVLPAVAFEAKAEGIDWFIFVGLQGGKPFEVFARTKFNQLNLEKPLEIVRVKSRHYQLRYKGGDVVLENVLSNEYPEVDYETRRVSMELRHGVPIEFILKQIAGSSLSVSSFAKCLGRIFHEFLSADDLEKLEQKPHGRCKECGSDNVEVRHEGRCFTLQCMSCGDTLSKCG